MFCHEVEGHMQKLRSFGRVKKRPKMSLTRLMHAFLQFLVKAADISFYYASIKGLFRSWSLTVVFSGAKTATPNQGLDANECPQGRFCPEGTDEPELCPPGTFSNALGKLKQAHKLYCLICRKHLKLNCVMTGICNLKKHWVQLLKTPCCKFKVTDVWKVLLRGQNV